MKEISVKVQYLYINLLFSHPSNPRKISEEDFESLCKSIEEDPLYFETRPIICSNRTGVNVVIAGNKRFLAAQKLGKTSVPVAIIPNLTESDETRILFKDNGSFGVWDVEALKEWDLDFGQLKDWGVDIEMPIIELPEFNVYEDDDDQSTIKNESFEQTANLEYIRFGKYKIPLSEIEITKLHTKIDSYMAENGTLVGFINSIVP